MITEYVVHARRDGKFWVLTISGSDLHVVGETQIYRFGWPTWRRRVRAMVTDWLLLNELQGRAGDFVITVFRC